MSIGTFLLPVCRHLGSVNTITFVDENRRFVTTSDDKSLRVWEWDTPVDMKYIAEPNMHSMPVVTLHPNGEGVFGCGQRNSMCQPFSICFLQLHVMIFMS